MKTLTPTVGHWLKKIGIRRGAPRLWFETRRVRTAGHVPGSRFDVVVLQHGIKLVPKVAVCSKEGNGRCLPAIDINTREVLAPLGPGGHPRCIANGRVSVPQVRTQGGTVTESPATPYY